MNKRFMRKQLAEMLIKKRKYYCEVDYLESTGTQWLDTGYAVNTSTDEVETYFQLITTDKYKWLMGEHDNGARFGIGSGDGSNLRNIAYGVSTYKVNDTEVYNSQHYFNANSNGVYLNGTQVHAFESFSSTSTVYLFNLNISGGGSGAAGRIWHYTHKRNGILIRDMIPVLDWNYTPCMYDKVTDTLFYNQGTGSFTYGREIHYVDYLESTGTQYIDTGVKLNSNFSVELDYQLTSASQSRAGLFGALSMTGSNQGRFGSILSPSNQYLEHGYGSGNDYWQQGMPNTNRHLLYQKKNEIYFDGELIHTFNTATFSLTMNAYLGNFVYTNYTPAKAKYYGSRWWSGNTLVRDYKPAIDENGVCFWFDRVTHSVFLNNGTGAFSYPAKQTEYTANAGTPAYIDLGVKYKSSMSIRGKFTRDGMGASGSVLLVTTNTTNPVLYFPALNAGGKTERYVWRRAGYNEQSYFMDFDDYPLTEEAILDAANDTLTVNGEVVLTGMIAGMNGYSSPYQSSSNLYMFSIAENYAGNGKVYYLQINDGSTPLFDLIPAYKDGIVGFYNKVDGTFYSNASSNVSAILTAGKIVEPIYE